MEERKDKDTLQSDSCGLGRGAVVITEDREIKQYQLESITFIGNDVEIPIHEERTYVQNNVGRSDTLVIDALSPRHEGVLYSNEDLRNSREGRQNARS